MSKDTIYREDAIKAFRSTVARCDPLLNGINMTLPLVEIALRLVPSADRPQGKWIVNMTNYESSCSVCGAKETAFIYETEMWYGLGESKFCPSCGARMKGADDE